MRTTAFLVSAAQGSTYNPWSSLGDSNCLPHYRRSLTPSTTLSLPDRTAGLLRLSGNELLRSRGSASAQRGPQRRLWSGMTCYNGCSHIQRVTSRRRQNVAAETREPHQLVLRQEFDVRKRYGGRLSRYVAAVTFSHLLWYSHRTGRRWQSCDVHCVLQYRIYERPLVGTIF
jgi:hypothetical protein